MDINDLKYDYVHSVANEIMPEYDMNDEGDFFQIPCNAPFIFLNRLAKNAIDFPFRYETFIKDKNIISIIEAYNMDVEKFWYAILFIYDITQQKCVNVLTLGDTAKVQASSLLGVLTNVDSITITTSNKKKLKVNDLMLINSINSYLMAFISDIQSSGSHTFKLTSLSDDLYSPSIQMWFAANRFLELFKILNLPNIRAKDHAVIYKNYFGGKVAVGGGKKTVSYNKLFLISRLMYLMKFTRNDSFLASDNSLKGILKQYKGYTLNTYSKVYSA